jgi:hypothetical protein
MQPCVDSTGSPGPRPGRRERRCCISECRPEVYKWSTLCELNTSQSSRRHVWRHSHTCQRADRVWRLRALSAKYSGLSRVQVQVQVQVQAVTPLRCLLLRIPPFFGRQVQVATPVRCLLPFAGDFLGCFFSLGAAGAAACTMRYIWPPASFFVSATFSSSALIPLASEATLRTSSEPATTPSKLATAASCSRTDAAGGVLLQHPPRSQLSVRTGAGERHAARRS